MFNHEKDYQKPYQTLLHAFKFMKGTSWIYNSVSFNTFTAKPLKKPISQCQACFMDIFIISLFYCLPINYFLKISACYISLERDFIAEYSTVSLIKLLPLNR